MHVYYLPKSQTEHIEKKRTLCYYIIGIEFKLKSVIQTSTTELIMIQNIERCKYH